MFKLGEVRQEISLNMLQMFKLERSKTGDTWICDKYLMFLFFLGGGGERELCKKKK